jgi:putative sterol carrier protein
MMVSAGPDLPGPRLQEEIEMANPEPPKSVDEVIALMPQTFVPEAAQGLKCVYQFNITGDGGKEFYADIDDGKLDVSEGKHDTPSVTITVEASDYLAMLTNPALGQQLFMSGKLRMEPLDMNLAMKMGQLFRPTT